VQVLDVESSIIIVHLRTKFVSERGRKTDAPRYVLLLTYKKIMKKFLVFFLFYFLLSLFFLETFQYDKRGPSYIYLYVLRFKDPVDLYPRYGIDVQKSYNVIIYNYNVTSRAIIYVIYKQYMCNSNSILLS